MTACRLFTALCLLAAFTHVGVAQADEGRRQGRGAGAQAPRVAEQAPRPPQAAPRVRAPEARPSRGSRQDALADSVRRVQSRTGGQVLSAERVPFEGRDINRVKVVDERGRVRVYMDDPASRPRRPPRPTRGDDD
ncbi:hypothetical protein ACW5F0_06855 [Luteimonas sp. A534]